MPDLTVQQIPAFGEAYSGVSQNELPLEASDDANLFFVNRSVGLGTYLYIENDSGVTKTCSIEGVPGPDSNRDVSRTVVLDDGERTVVGPFKPSLYNNTDGKVEVSITGADAAWQFVAFQLTAG